MTGSKRSATDNAVARIAAKAALPVSAAYAVFAGSRAASANGSVADITNAAIDAGSMIASVASRVATPVTVAYAGYKSAQTASAGGSAGQIVQAAVDAATFGLGSYAMSGSVPGRAAAGRLASRARSTGRAYLNAKAEQRAQAARPVASAPGAAAPAPATGGPRGFANPTVQRLAQQARRRSGK